MPSDLEGDDDDEEEEAGIFPADEDGSFPD